MAITRAGAITAAAKAVSKYRENEKRRKSAARKRKWRERQSAERQSEIQQTDRTGHAEGRARLSEDISVLSFLCCSIVRHYCPFYLS